jgi:protein disulfide-isomerase
MKKLLMLGLGFVAAFSAQATVKVGDAYETVIAEKGTPGGKMNVRGVLLLCYTDETIKVKDGKVIAISIPKNATVAAPTPAPATPAGTQGGTQFKPAVWTTNYADALKEAKEKNRHVFVFFTGSDWCGWCQRLKGEILSTPQFQNYARENLVLVEIDFPRRKTLPTELVAQNAKLQDQFRITGYPTVIVLNNRGKPIGDMGYQEGGPGPFIEQLRTM